MVYQLGLKSTHAIKKFKTNFLGIYREIVEFNGVKQLKMIKRYWLGLAQPQSMIYHNFPHF